MNVVELVDYVVFILLGLFCMIFVIMIMNSIFNLDGDRVIGRYGE